MIGTLQNFAKILEWWGPTLWFYTDTPAKILDSKATFIKLILNIDFSATQNRFYLLTYSLHWYYIMWFSDWQEKVLWFCKRFCYNYNYSRIQPNLGLVNLYLSTSMNYFNKRLLFIAAKVWHAGEKHCFYLLLLRKAEKKNFISKTLKHLNITDSSYTLLYLAFFVGEN